MAHLDFLVAAFLDPVAGALVLAIILVYRGPMPILVAGVAAAIMAEGIMALVAVDYVLGELILPRLIAALMQAAVLVWAVRLVRSLARSGANGHAASPLSGEAAALEPAVAGSAGPASPRRRLAPWHMRAYVRRRIVRLYRK